jgi:hypothetical protein
MRSEKDIMEAYSNTKSFPSSPRDPKLRNIEITSHVIYLLAGYCAWQIGSWWGIGLVIAFYLIDLLNGMTADEYRQELVELHSKLSMEILKNSDILDDTFEKNSRAST